MLARIRKIVLFSSAAVAVLVLIAYIVGQHRAYERLIQAEIAKVSRKQNTYIRVWDKLVAEHGSQDAALDALRAWAASLIDYREAEARWKRGQGTRPEIPESLVNFSEIEEEQFSQIGGIPYGCSVTYTDGTHSVTVGSKYDPMYNTLFD